jgi:hypothetical protein
METNPQIKNCPESGIIPPKTRFPPEEQGEAGWAVMNVGF